MRGIGKNFLAKPNKSFVLSPFKPNTQGNHSVEKKLPPPLQPPLFKESEQRFFTHLKAEEKRQFSNKRRLRFDYRKNSSAALTLPVPLKELIAQQNNPDSLLELSKNNIIAHANLRVDLFFYTLIAYYNTGILPTEGHTYLQHGKGRNNNNQKTITEACHSSFTPSLLDQTIYVGRQGVKRRRSILSGTHFMENLNATVELPSFVNDLDDILENGCRKKSLKILADVSSGALNPIEGIHLFLKTIETVLTDLKKQADKENLIPLQHFFIGKKFSNSKLIDLVIHGTFSTTFDDKTQSIKEEYIQLLLRLTPEEKSSCLDEESKTIIYSDKFMSIQKEILETKWNMTSLML